MKGLRQIVEREGLVLLGVVRPETVLDGKRYREWIAAGKHAGMEYLAKNVELRERPGGIFPGTRSVIVLGLPYYLGDRYPFDGAPRVAQYARFRDYHKILREKGERIASTLTGGSAMGGYKIIVDTVPVLERALAAQTSESFVGKNTCVIHKTEGSFLLLGEIFSSIEFEADAPNSVDLEKKTKAGGCGPCTRCQDHCPTGALNEDYTIDSGLCLAYWTIENRGPIPEKFWPHLGRYYYGCDICQLVCPYNAGEKRSAIAERVIPTLFEVATMGEKQYQSYFGGTPMTRAKRNGLRRNALIALAVTGDASLPDALELAAKDADPPIGETLKQIEGYLLPT